MTTGAELIAVTYGIGKDSHVAVVLALIRHNEGLREEHDQFVTWRANMQVDSASQVAEGDYMSRGKMDDESWAQKAWDNYERRSRQLYRLIPQWIKLEITENEDRATTSQ